MNITVHCINPKNMAYWGVPKNTMRPMDFERDYMPGVVSGEMGDCSQFEALKAQAIAARSYAYQYILKGAAIYDTGKAQAFLASRAVSSRYLPHIQAAKDTDGIILTFNGKPCNTHYSASNGGYVRKSSNAWEPGGYPDPYDDGELDGHGSGMSQRGAENMAKAGKTYAEILQFYYPGTVLMGDYGKTVIMPNDNQIETEVESVENTIADNGLTIVQAIQTKNLCYIESKPASPVGILVHSTGAVNRELRRYVDAVDIVGKNQYNNHWNRAKAGGIRFTKMVHAFIGYDKTFNDAKNVIAIQTLPYSYRCWGCASGKRGSYNVDPQAHIQFEICQGSNKDDVYYWKAIGAAEKYCAFLCRKFGFDAADIVSHKEAHDLGYANNHGDPENWMKYFGDDMHKFRERVAVLLGEATEVTGENTQESPQDGQGSTLPTLRKGSEGEEVKALQNLLNQPENGAYQLKVDGKFGPLTRDAVTKFQQDNGLKIDGIVGRNTWKKLTV